MTYYLLLERENEDSPWSTEFGSTDKSDVAFEIDDRHDHGAKRKNLRIIAFGRVPFQRQIDERIAEVNGAAPLALPIAARRIEVTP